MFFIPAQICLSGNRKQTSGYILSQIPGVLIEPDLFKYPNSKKLHRHRNLLVAFVHLRGMWCRHTMAEQGQSLRLKVFKYFPAGLDFFFFGSSVFSTIFLSGKK